MKISQLGSVVALLWRWFTSAAVPKAKAGAPALAEGKPEEPVIEKTANAPGPWPASHLERRSQRYYGARLASEHARKATERSLARQKGKRGGRHDFDFWLRVALGHERQMRGGR